MYKIWVNDGTTSRPDDDFFYEVGSSGIFIHKKMKYWHAVVPVKGIGFLEASEPSAKLFLPAIPENIIKDLVRFFAWIYRKHKTEVGAMLWLNEASKTYRISVPRQLVGHGSIEYKEANEDRLPGEVLIGTAHSHCEMSAFHSSTDTHDEESIDGIHLTFGKFSKNPDATKFDISAEVALNGTRFKLNIPDWLGGISVGEVQKEDDDDEENIIFAGFTVRRKKPSIGRFYFSNGELVMPVGYAPPLEWVSRVKVKETPKGKGRGKNRFFQFPFEVE